MSIVTVCPNIDLNLQHKDVKLLSPNAVTIRQWISTSYSNNQASFSMPPPSTSVFIDRCFMKATPVTIAYAGSTTGSNMLQLGYDALRAYPIASITNSDQLTLNNSTFTMQTSELVPYMARYWKAEHYSSFPSYLDTYQVYADGVAAINNPLGAYFNAIDHHQPRGGYPMIVVNASTSASITATIYEPIWLPCLHRNFENGLGFTNIRTCDLVTNYNANLARIVSHALSLATISSITVTMGQPIVYMKYSTPSMGYVPPPVMTYGSEDINRFITPYGATLTANSSATITSTNIQLGGVPRWVLIFCRESNANLTYASTDTACNISNVSINFDNQSGILSSSSEMNLYLMSAKNCLQDTWEQYHGVTSNLATQVGTTGSFLKLFFGKDIPLTPGSYPGKIGAYNLSMNVTVKNINQSASITAPNLYIITSVPQKLLIHNGGQVETILGIEERGDGEYVQYDNVVKYYGGSFHSFAAKVGKFFRPVVDWLKKTHLISTVASFIPHPLAQTISGVASRAGFGDGDGDGDGGMTVGGRVASRAELMKRIKKYG